MPGRHPRPDLLELYFMNHASDDERAMVESHVFTCASCFSRIASLDIDAVALTKACLILGDLENQGTRVLTIPALKADRPCVILPNLPQRFVLRYAAIAAIALLSAATLSSVGLLHKENMRAVSASEIALRNTARRNLELAGVSLVPDLLRGDTTPRPPKVTVRKRDLSEETEAVIMQVRFERPFMPPSRHTEGPELNMAHVPPTVVAQRLEPPKVIATLPRAPKPRVRRSRRVLQALASPFKKLGGTFAFLRH